MPYNVGPCVGKCPFVIQYLGTYNNMEVLVETADSDILYSTFPAGPTGGYTTTATICFKLASEVHGLEVFQH